MAKLKVGVLISGRGSNLAALIEAAKAADYPAEVACVVSNKADAPGLAIAAAAGVPTAVVSHRDHPDRETFDRAVSAELERHGVELVVLAGFMRIFSPWFPTRWADRLINIHPSCCRPSRGSTCSARHSTPASALSGCTAHLVTPDLDPGPHHRPGRRAWFWLATPRRRYRPASCARSTGSIRWWCVGSPKAGSRSTAERVAVKGAACDAALLFSPEP